MDDSGKSLSERHPTKSLCDVIYSGFPPSYILFGTFVLVTLRFLQKKKTLKNVKFTRFSGFFDYRG